MNIIIVGAGEVGRYVASVLSKPHKVILIDHNKRDLEAAASQMDIGTRYGSATDWQLLDDLLEFSPHFFIALTNDDEVNLVACTLAKHLGYPRTIARVRSDRYLNRARLDVARIFSIDYFIAPEVLVADNVLKMIMSGGSLMLESFANGAVEMRTLLVPASWSKHEKTLEELDLPKGVMIGLIQRKEEVSGISKLIFPHGGDHILPNDEITLIGETDYCFRDPSLFWIDAEIGDFGFNYWRNLNGVEFG